jgi:hypothetical protein
MSPKTKLRLFLLGVSLNRVMTIVNLVFMLVSLAAEIQIPLRAFIATGMTSICWFLCADGVEKVKEWYNLDDAGNPKGDKNGTVGK